MKQQHIFSTIAWRSEMLHLVLITLVASLLRIYALATLPAALNRDEAALGYNAWLLQTSGVDEWGERWPVALQSFGDYKLPGYPLLTIISFWLFGRTDFAVRMPSAVAGSLLPLAVWFLLKQTQSSKRASIFAAWLIAVSPFSIFYARMAFEASVALTIFTVVIALVFRSLASRLPSWRQLLSISILLTAAIFTYNTPLLLTPFLIMAILLFSIGRSWRNYMPVVMALLLPLIIGAFSLWQLSQHKAGISIFSDPTITAEIMQRYAQASSLSEKFMASKYVVYLGMMAKNMFASWSPNFLIIRGGSHPWHTIPQAAHLTWFSYLFGIGGVFLATHAVLRSIGSLRSWSFPQRTRAILLWLLLAGLAPAAITTDAPHATRSLLFLVLLVVFAAISADLILAWIEKKHAQMRLLAVTAMACFAVLGALNYLNLYFRHYPQTQAMFQPGLATVLPTLATVGKPILVAGDGYTYISLAWYQPITPNEFLATIKRHPIDTIGFAAGKSVGNYTVRPDFQTPEATQAGLLFWQQDHWQTSQLP